jgi:biopolymer transport protein ExbB
MDELELSKTARPVGFIKLAALEQGGDAAAKLLVVGQDEQPAAGWLSGALGLFGVILKSVTIDGWVIIGFLAVLGCVSWYVMITKFFYLNAVEKGNAEFLKQWSEVSTDLTGLDHSDAESMKSLGGRIGGKLARLMRMSPLFHVYHIGSNEIRQRISDPRYGRVLSAQSIQAIRAALDGGYVRQGQAINGGLVFLTISIAGGPFIGLLGTVAGVMITFASIAATGEVNINAIAPGISAALVATLAGLVVAIPALLGYNYLTSRIRNVTADLQIFIDEFVTKMAEFYRPGAEPATELEVSH